jgi:arylsulfatase A-like enzyme
LFINYYDVHAPYVAPASPAPGFGHASAWTVDRISSAIKIQNSRLRLSPEDQETLIAGYDNCLASLDARVGELLDSFSRLPGWKNTIVIITADHGEDFGEHGTYAHGLDLYRGVLHVPLIILGPNVPAGVRITPVVSIQDLFETVLQLTGIPDPPFRQVSLQRYWSPGFGAPRDDDVVSELIPQNKRYPAAMSLTTSEWQYLRDAQGNEELYHWVSDPAEKVNVATGPENRAILKELEARLRATVSESLHPWEGAAYVTALGEANQTSPPRGLVGTMNLSSGQPSRIPIGTAQAVFGGRAQFLTGRPSSMDDELLQSLPYQ